jgi:ABC-2 type transport system ATP-binding protein
MIQVSGLEKTFGEKTVINNLSFSLVSGEILGFLGPNGAGKSTTMKILTGFLKPSAGSVSVFGHDVLADPVAAQKQMGYLPEGAPAYEEMTVLAFLEFIAEIRGFDAQQRRDRITDVVRKMSLQDVLTQKIETLSKGFKRRVGLAQAIIHDPAVLILDEPTDGLDPNQKQQVRALIQSLSKDKIVIISTHILEEVTAVCNRVIIISEGKMVADCSPSALEQESRYHGAVTIRLEEAHREAVLASIRGLAEVDSVDVASVLVGTCDLTVFGKQGVELYPYLSRFLTRQELVPLGMFQEKGRLDDVFRRFTVSEGVVGTDLINDAAATERSAAEKRQAI